MEQLVEKVEGTFKRKKQIISQIHDGRKSTSTCSAFF